MKSSWCRAFPREGLPNQQAKPPFKRELNYLGLDFPVSHLFATPNHPEEWSLWRCITQEEQGLTSDQILPLTPWPACKFVAWADGCCNLFLQGYQNLVMKTNRDKRWSHVSECHSLITSLIWTLSVKKRVRWESDHLIHMKSGYNAFLTKSTTAHSCLSWRKWSQGNYTSPAGSLLTSLLVI